MHKTGGCGENLFGRLLNLQKLWDNMFAASVRTFDPAKDNPYENPDISSAVFLKLDSSSLPKWPNANKA